MDLPTERLDPLDIVAVGTATGPGTAVGFGGGIGVSATVQPDPDGHTYEVRATATIGEFFGGSIGDVKIVTIHTDEDGLVIVENESEYAAVIPGADTWSVQLDCPASSRGIAIVDTTIHGAGQNLSGSLGPGFEGLSGGTDVTATSVLPFACESNGLAGPEFGEPMPAASLACMQVDARHIEFTSGSGDQLVNYPSYLKGRGIVWVWGTPEQAALEAVVRLRGVNGGRSMRVPLVATDGADDVLIGDSDGEQVDAHNEFEVDTWRPIVGGEPKEPVRQYVFEFDGGINDPGNKLITDFIVRAADSKADLTGQAREALGGKNLKVRFPQEDSFGDCPENYADLDPSQPYLPVIIK